VRRIGAFSDPVAEEIDPILVRQLRIAKMTKSNLNRSSQRRRQSGVTLIEYALIAALIAVVAIASLTSVGNNLKAKFTSVATSLG